MPGETRNKNCLAGFRCPHCNADGLFKIVAKALFEVRDDGTECVGDVEWDDNSFCECGGCKFRGKVKNFTAPSPGGANERKRRS